MHVEGMCCTLCGIHGMYVCVYVILTQFGVCLSGKMVFGFVFK